MIDKLMNFGLSRLEATAYIALLREPGITGYRLSHILDKPTANIYKALKSLELKGLADIDKSAKVQSIYPVPVEEFLYSQELLFKSRSKDLQESLKDISGKKNDYRISRLDSFEQAVSKAIQIIEGVESVLVIVAFEEVLKELEASLLIKKEQGVDIYIYTYSAYSLDGCRVFYSEKDARIWTSIPERAFDIAADGKVFMISNFRDNYKEVIEALYGNHVYLSLMIFNSLSKNILFQEMISEDFFSSGTKEEMAAYFREHGTLLSENLPVMKSFFKKHNIPFDTIC